MKMVIITPDRLSGGLGTNPQSTIQSVVECNFGVQYF